VEAGCTDAEVAAIAGQSRDMVEHYARAVNQGWTDSREARQDQETPCDRESGRRDLERLIFNRLPGVKPN